MWHRCTRSDVSLDYVLGIAGFDLQRTLAQNPGFMDVGAAPTQFLPCVHVRSPAVCSAFYAALSV